MKRLFGGSMESKPTYLAVFDETPAPSRARRWFWFVFAAAFVAFHLFGDSLLQWLLGQLQ